VAVPVYPPRFNHSLDRLQTIISNAEASVALTTGHMRSLIQTSIKENQPLLSTKWIATDTDELYDPIEWIDNDMTKEDIAFFQYTSGSTSEPKGVMLSHGNLLTNLQLIERSFGFSRESSTVSWLPPYHDMGLIGAILSPIFSGSPIHLMSPVDFLKNPFLWLSLITKKKATCSGAPNFAYEMCIQKISEEKKLTLDLSNWAVAFNGAEPVRNSTLNRFTEAFAGSGFKKTALYPCYGLAESTLFVSGGERNVEPIYRSFSKKGLQQNIVQRIDENDIDAMTLVSSGRSNPDHQIMIVNPDTEFPCESQQVGEIWLKGGSVAKGYWQTPEKTQSTFQAYLANTEEGPYLRTGDMGFIDEGQLFVTGRMKNMMIIRGINIYPHDLEATVQRSHPSLSVGNGAAFTVEVNNEEQLVIVQEVERTFRKKIDPQEVIAIIRKEIAVNHGLQVFALLLVTPGEIPKTSSGKVQHHICRDLFLEGTFKTLDNGIWQMNEM
jgi:acyl-CoA synthetase (AMP-forming)/AMP-acid ligase II